MAKQSVIHPRKHRKSAVAVSPSQPEREVPVEPSPGVSAKTDSPRSIKEPDVMTLDEAFNYYWAPNTCADGRNSPLNLERAVRAVAFLLHWQSDIGNERVEGNSANGLAFILEEVAAQLAPR